MRSSVVVTGLIFASVMALGASVTAQQAKPHSMIGCLARNTETIKTDKGGNTFRTTTYKVTDIEGNGPKTAEIVEGHPPLAIYLNHKVEITGTAVQGKDKAMHYMKVTGIKTLANDCP